MKSKEEGLIFYYVHSTSPPLKVSFTAHAILVIPGNTSIAHCSLQWNLKCYFKQFLNPYIIAILIM